MKNTIITFVGLTTLAFVSCNNPADQSKEAETSAPKEVPDAPATGEKWNFTEDSTITFVGSKVTGSHTGGFKKFEGSFHINNDTLSPNGHKVVIDMASIYSDAEKLTTKLKSDEFFDVEKYPTATFIATSLKTESGPSNATHILTGNLDLHGVEKSINIPVKVTKDAEKIHILADFFINRFDFNIEYPGKTDDLIRKEVVIKFDLKATPSN